MAKKRSPLEIRKNDLDYRWGCRIRDSRFKKDYEDYKDGHLGEIDLCNKWGLDFVPDDLNETANPLGDSDVPVQLLDVIEGEVTVSLVEPRVKTRATLDEESNTFRITGRNELITRHTFKVPADERRVIIALNPRQPLRLILEGIKLRPWEGRKRNAKAGRAKKNIDLCFEVYDRYQKGEDYSSIAANLHRAPSVVIRAHFQVYQDIHGEPPPRKKKLRRLKEFNPQTHFQICQTCQNAEDAEELCPAGRDFVDQDTSYQREILIDPAPSKN